MRHVLIYLAWLAVSTGVVAALFAPEIGLLHSGPFGAIGLGLLGLAMMRHQSERPAA